MGRDQLHHSTGDLEATTLKQAGSSACADLEAEGFDDVLCSSSAIQVPLAQDADDVEHMRTSICVQNGPMPSSSRHAILVLVFYSMWGVAAWSPSWCAKWYQRLMRFTLACGTVVFIINLIQQPDLWGNFAQTAFAIGSLVSMASLQGFHCQNTIPLESFARDHGFLDLWDRSSFRYLVLVSFAWMSKVIACMLEFHASNQVVSMRSMMSHFFSLFMTGAYCALVHCMCHALIFLRLTLDNYLVEFYRTKDWSLAVCAWNTVHTILSRVSCALDSSFLAVQTSGTLGLLCFAVKLLNEVVTGSAGGQRDQIILKMLLHLPTVLMAACAFLLLVQAAAITETCVTIPTVVNSAQVTSENATSPKRLYVVAFIKHCQAGFSIKGSLVNATVLLNYCYLCGAVLCGIFTTGLSLSRS